MPQNVYAFPPVRITAYMPWVERAPVNVSRSFFTGARMTSSSQRKRRVTQLVVEGLAGDRDGAGYMENLRILTAGGESLVRLNSRPVNWSRDDCRLRSVRQSAPVLWGVAEDADVEWLDPDVVPWVSGALLVAVASTDAEGFPAVEITGAPANKIIARAGETVSLFDPISSVSAQTARVMKTARTDEEGVASIRLMTPLEGSGRLTIGEPETAVFEITSMSEPVQPMAANWSYAVTFSEIFADEVPGGFVEIDPWR